MQASKVKAILFDDPRGCSVWARTEKVSEWNVKRIMARMFFMIISAKYHNQYKYIFGYSNDLSICKKSA